jgi:hypothetical protein
METRPLAYIVSANLARRNLTKGQQAMALAIIYPEPGSRTKKDAAKATESGGFSKSRLREARSVLRHSRELAESVVKGSVSLDEALTKVEELKQQAHPHTQNWHGFEQRHGILRRVWRMKTSEWMRRGDSEPA